MSVDLLCMGEPMLEFNQLPPQPNGSRHYLEGHGGDTSNAAISRAARASTGNRRVTSRMGFAMVIP